MTTESLIRLSECEKCGKSVVRSLMKDIKHLELENERLREENDEYRRGIKLLSGIANKEINQTMRTLRAKKCRKK